MEINRINLTEKPTFRPLKRKALQLHEGALLSFQRSRGTTGKRREYSDKDSFDDEKGEVKRKMVALQRIVPGGEDLGVDQLFEETAAYILALQSQIRAMKALAAFIEGLGKEKTKLGG
ncbi:hypothetical protein GQ457_06G034330 [Hibiscus cannabinus]